MPSEVRILAPTLIKMINKILMDEEGRKYYWERGNLSTHLGLIKEKDIKRKKEVKSNLGKKFIVLDANFIDNLNKIKHSSATTHLKDVGPILIYSGVGKNSVVLEAGSGSGKLTSLLARFCKRVYSYEKNKNSYEITKKNLAFLNIKNVKLVNKDVKESKERNLDLVVLDLLDPWNYVNIANKLLKNSGYLVSYLTNINQVSSLSSNLKKEFIVERIIEVNERDWISKGLVLRPEHWGLVHTAFLLFARKR
ncbi:MAG: methyltransferase domain-containing protein [Nanoarchaeota archaeon]